MYQTSPDTDMCECMYRLAESMVDQGGIELLLALPRNHFTHSGLALVFFGLGGMPTALDRLAALPNGVPAQVIWSPLY